MSIITIFFIAFGLSMDAFAISITSGLIIKRLKITYALRIAFFFGLFQAIMPIIGWLAGITLKNFISGTDHWIAFGLLSFIGCKMIYESTKMERNEKGFDPLNTYVLLLLSIATSVDALAVGLSLSLLKILIITPAVIIGIVTFLLCLIGVYIGDKFGHFFERKIEVVGGLVLIGIGIKILIQHLL